MGLGIAMVVLATLLSLILPVDEQDLNVGDFQEKACS